MAVTPEGKVKKKVKDVLKEFSEVVHINGFTVSTLKQFWPVPSGFGASDLDCIVCYYGMYFGIETKAPGEKPTARQNLTIAQTIGAGGIALVVATDEDVEMLRRYLQGIKNARSNDSQRQA